MGAARKLDLKSERESQANKLSQLFTGQRGAEPQCGGIMLRLQASGSIGLGKSALSKGAWPAICEHRRVSVRL